MKKTKGTLFTVRHKERNSGHSQKKDQVGRERKQSRVKENRIEGGKWREEAKKRKMRGKEMGGKHS